MVAGPFPQHIQAILTIRCESAGDSLGALSQTAGGFLNRDYGFANTFTRYFQERVEHSRQFHAKTPVYTGPANLLRHLSMPTQHLGVANTT